MSSQQRRVLALLRSGVRWPVDIAHRLGMSPRQLEQVLLALQAQGLAEREAPIRLAWMDPAYQDPPLFAEWGP